VVCTQNHDQVGNRALGERAAALMSDGRLRVAAALLLTSPFVPLLFQGEEWGAGTPFQYFTSHTDPDLARVVSAGRREEFSAFAWGPVPDPQDPATFERSRLDWAELSLERNVSLLAWYAQLIALRRRVPALTDPRLDQVETACDPDLGRLEVRRGPVVVAANLGSSDWSFRAGPAAELLAASDHRIGRTDRGLILPPDTVAILAAASGRPLRLSAHPTTKGLSSL
jgi:maltooligosyltrehalose trehalohydrolase